MCGSFDGGCTISVLNCVVEVEVVSKQSMVDGDCKSFSYCVGAGTFHTCIACGRDSARLLDASRVSVVG